LCGCERKLGRPESAAAFGREAVEAARASGDRVALGIALTGLAGALFATGDLSATREVYEESVANARESGDSYSLSASLTGLGEVARLMGDRRAARAYYEQSLEEEDFAAVAAYYREALAMAVGLEDHFVAAMSLDGLAAVALNEGVGERAALLAGAAEAHLEASGDPLDELEQSLRDRYVAKLRSTLDPATLEREWARGRAMTLQEAAAAALAG
jgi:tetratricopeptide (TPR) repeat protein